MALSVGGSTYALFESSRRWEIDEVELPMTPLRGARQLLFLAQLELDW